MTSERSPCVYIVDDDVPILNAFSRLLETAGYSVQAFSSPGDFLAKHDPDQPGCALFDVGMEELDGLSLQDRLLEAGIVRPVIFVTAQDNARSGVRAMKAGAVDYLTKPVHEDVLLAAIASAIESDVSARQSRSEVAEVAKRQESLTTREREVMDLVVQGRLNKQIAHDLGVVEKTVKVHRARVMEKMQVRSVAALVHLVEQLTGYRKGKS
jgi:FixJ family two-component response regulator